MRQRVYLVLPTLQGAHHGGLGVLCLNAHRAGLQAVHASRAFNSDSLLLDQAVLSGGWIAAAMVADDGFVGAKLDRDGVSSLLGSS